MEERKKLIGWIVILISILFYVLDFYGISATLFAILAVAGYGIIVFRWNKLEPLNGSFPLRLAINEHEIRIGDKSFPIKELSIEKLTNSDYKGRMIINYLFINRYPIKSNGTSNNLWFIHDTKEYRLQFLIDSEQQLKQLDELKNKLGVKQKKPLF